MVSITHLPKAQGHCLYGSSLTLQVYAKENANTILSIFEIKDMSQPYNSNKNTPYKNDQGLVWIGCSQRCVFKMCVLKTSF